MSDMEESLNEAFMKERLGVGGPASSREEVAGVKTDRQLDGHVKEEKSSSTFTGSYIELKDHRKELDKLLEHVRDDLSKSITNMLDMASLLPRISTVSRYASSILVSYLCLPYPSSNERILTHDTATKLQMYKSVAIRDTRVSLELNHSLWRLSWVTFIFLPLTFLCGFFGMNVDWFTDNPSAKW